MDDQLIDAIRHLASDPTANPKVKKKLISILASWNTQFKNDPSLSIIADLYLHTRRSHVRSASAGPTISDKDAAKKRAKEDAKERARKAEEEARQMRNRPRTAPFNFEAVSFTTLHSQLTAHVVHRKSPTYWHRLRAPAKHRATWSMRSCWSTATRRASPPTPAFKSVSRTQRRRARPSSGTYR